MSKVISKIIISKYYFNYFKNKKPNLKERVILSTNVKIRIATYPVYLGVNHFVASFALNSCSLCITWQMFITIINNFRIYTYIYTISETVEHFL